MIAPRFIARVAAVLPAAALATGAVAQELPPIPSGLLGKSAAACIKVGADGKVAEAFLIETSNDPALDAQKLDWIRHVQWDPAKFPASKRDKWFPIALGFGGGAVAPAMPASCGPKSTKPAPTRSS